MTINIADAANLPTTPTIGVDEGAAVWDVSKWTIYDGAAAGTLPVQPLRVGRRLRWPTIPVLQSVGIDPLTADQMVTEKQQVGRHVDHDRHAGVNAPTRSRGQQHGPDLGDDAA